MTGPENPAFEKWDAAAKAPEAIAAQAPRGSGRFAAAALAAGALAAIALPGERLGLGAFLVALALVAVCTAVTSRPAHVAARGGFVATDAAVTARPAHAGAERRWSVAWCVVALLLASTVVIRDATWVVLPALLGAVGFGSLAMAGGRTGRAVLRGAFAALARAPRGARLVVASVPVQSGRPIAPVARGVGLAAVLVTVFGLLFVSGDAAFAQLAEDTLVTGWETDDVFLRGLAFAGVVALAGGLALARIHGVSDGARRTKRGVTEWLVALIALDALFALFVGVQLTVLFGGGDHVLQTAGLTYSEYAREGFAQLLVAAALTLAVVAVAPRHRVALVVLCALTLVVVASALHRVDLYQDAYGATRLRFAAHAAILMVGALVGLTLAALAADRFAWLPRAAAASVALGLLAFVAANPDRQIAERNLARDTVDEAYLRTLSADAAPALPVWLERLPADDGLFGWNRARARAR